MGNDFSQQEYPFVGREDALQAFAEVIQDPQRKYRVLFYRGAGGIGKTKLLQEIIRRYHDQVGLVVAPNILDMAVTRTHRISGVREEIADLLGKEYFAKYRAKQERFLTERDKPDGERVAESALRGLQKAADDQFKEDCRKAYPDRIVVLLFDTFEKVIREDVGHYVLYELPQDLPNFVFIIASRTPCPVEELVRTMELKGLAPEDAPAFFTSRRQPISDEMAATLWKKLDGHPLRLDMALLWLSVGALSVEELIELPTDEKPCSPFDRTLLERLQMLGRVPGVTPETVAGEERGRQEAAAFQIILLMAYFNRRFNRMFLGHTYTTGPGQASLDEAFNILDRLPALVFIKRRPDGDLQLHDELERLILACMRDMLAARTVGGPWTLAEKELAWRAVNVYDYLIEETDREAEQTNKEDRDDLERKALELRTERLGYVLRVDLDQGYEYFIEHFDRNLRNREFGLCELFMAEIMPYKDRYNPRRFEIEDRQFQLALARGDFARAKELAETPKQKALLLFGLHSNTYASEPAQAKQHLLEALGICQKATLSLDKTWSLVTEEQEGLLEACEGKPLPLGPLALAQQRLGWTCRLLGQMEEAIRWYENCCKTAKQMGKKGLWLYTEAQNSLGYIYGMVGRYDEARTLVSRSLKLRQQRGWQREVGYSYSTLGESNRFQRDYRAANTFYSYALEIFRALRDPEWQAIILHQRGENTRQIAWKQYKHEEKQSAKELLEEAERDLRESRHLYEEYNVRRDYWIMLRRLGRTVRDKGFLAEAKELFQEGYEKAVSVGDLREQLECLVDLADIAIKQKEYVEVETYLKQIEEFTLHERVFHYPVLRGMIHIIRGDALLKQRCWDMALDEYCKGFTHLGKVSGYGHARLSDRLDRFEANLDELPDEATKHAWCGKLVEVWEKEGLDKDLPELTCLCSRYEESLVFLEEE